MDHLGYCKLQPISSIDSTEFMTERRQTGRSQKSRPLMDMEHMKDLGRVRRNQLASYLYYRLWIFLGGG
jgi:hypothetical protein